MKNTENYFLKMFQIMTRAIRCNLLHFAGGRLHRRRETFTLTQIKVLTSRLKFNINIH